MTRKLLPFEHELIDTLGISKDEYLEFVALYEKSDFEGKPTAEVGTYALVLTIIGILFQVASAIFTQAPSFDVSRGGQPQTRDERFSPRFGFNSTQELAAYGDPVNLVYANRGTGTGANPNGGVRVTASLLWSAVRSYGSSQFIQMLMMLSGGEVVEIDNEKSAFGQTPLRDLMSENIWMYFNPGATGFLQQQNEIFGNKDTDPTRYGYGTDNPYRIQTTAEDLRKDGFSQAYSPTTANTTGIYGVIPLNILLFLRNSSGSKANANLGITASGISWTSATPTPAINLNDVLTVTLATTKANTADTDVIKETKDARRSLLSVFDTASTFKLGTAIFRVTSISSTNIDEQDITVKLKCIQAGLAPTATYPTVQSSKTVGGITKDEEQELTKLKATVQKLLNEDANPAKDTAVKLVESGQIDKATLVSQKTYVKYNEAFTPGGTGAGGILLSGKLKPGYYVEKTGVGAAAVTKYYTFKTVNSGYVKSRSLTSEEIKILYRYIQLSGLQSEFKDDTFYTKALVRIATAKYETLSACHIVDFAIKAIVYKRISGRQLEYGSNRARGYPASDNGIKPRVSMFKLRYREVGQDIWATVPGIFAISRAADNENFVYFKFNSGLTTAASATHWEFDLETIEDSK